MLQQADKSLRWGVCEYLKKLASLTLQSEDEGKCSLPTNESNQVMVGGKKKLMDDSGMGENSWKVLEIKQAIRNL